MYNKYMSMKQLMVKKGDRVSVCGWAGTVLDVFNGKDTRWNGKKYVPIPDSDYTSITVHFDNPEDIGFQYQDGNYSDWQPLEEVSNG